MTSEGPRFRLVRWMFGGLLLLAALLKLQQWIGGSGETYLTASALLQKSLAVGEFLLSLWLLSGIRATVSLLAATGIFGCFAAVSLWKISHGITECGCFGKIIFSPKLSYWIDIAAFISGLGALGTHTPPSWWGSLLRKRGSLLPAILLLAIVSYGLGLSQGRNPVAEPENRFGRFWPLPGDIDIPVDLSQGRWIVLLYNSSCGHCSSMADDYAESAQKWCEQGKKTRLALIDADFGSESETPTSHLGVVGGKLMRSDLYRNIPVLILLVNGRVWAVEEQWEEIDWSRPPHSGWIQ